MNKPVHALLELYIVLLVSLWQGQITGSSNLTQMVSGGPLTKIWFSIAGQLLSLCFPFVSFNH